MLKTLLIFILLVSSSLAWSRDAESDCDRELLSELFGDLQKITFGGLDRKNDHEWTELDLVCKTRPGYPNQVIVATFFVSNTPPAEVSERDVGFSVAVVDPAQRRLVSLHTSKLLQDGGTNAFWSGSLAIDTARYDLKNGVRAIGVRMAIVQPGCAWESTSESALWLFVARGPVLQPVLSGFDMYRTERQFFKGCICCSQEESKGAVHHAALTLSVASSANNGYRDLALRANLSSVEYNLPVTINKIIVPVGLMKFDGHQYREQEVEHRIKTLFETRTRKYEKWR